jgi:phage gpG-like protein
MAFAYSYQVDETGYDGLFKAFVRASKEANMEAKEVLERFAPGFADDIRKTFDAGGARGGRHKWRITKNPTPLIDTKRLYNSFNGRVEEHGDEIRVIVGTDVPYARQHNEGIATIGEHERRLLYSTGGLAFMRKVKVREHRRKIIQREFMFLTEEDLSVLDDASSFIFKAISDILGAEAAF